MSTSLLLYSDDATEKASQYIISMKSTFTTKSHVLMGKNAFLNFAKRI
jgi:hypothetical protein